MNVSRQLSDRLHAGMQLYSRDVGTFRDLPPRIDWAYLDYRAKPWLGLRAGVIKMPYGLYNEYEDIDSARTAILLPQSVYSIRNRSALLAQTGFAVYGQPRLGRSGGSLEYQAWLGTLNIPNDALEVSGNATLDTSQAKYVTGAQVFWHTPLEGLRVGGSFLRASIDFHLTLDPSTVAALVMAGVVPPTYDGAIVVSQRPTEFWLGSAEYSWNDWLFAAEYGRTYTRQETSLPTLLPTTEKRGEAFYVLVTRRLSEHLEAGAYYSVEHPEVNDRGGHDKAMFPDPFDAWQRDAATTVRFDVNDHWLWKFEAHFIDGAADIDLNANPHPTRFWGLLLFETTVTF